MKKISIVTPCYNEEENIRLCYQAIRELFDGPLSGYEREHVFCDNASTDRTQTLLRELATEDSKVRIILNSRNFGILRNTFNGVRACAGDAIVLFFPADLQDPVEVIPQFVSLWESGYEVVFGIRAQREEPFFTKMFRKGYYRLLSRLSDVNYPPDVGDFQLVDRKVWEVFTRFPDTQPFMRMMTFECGFRSIGVPYTWRRRVAGLSKNRWSNLIDQGFNGLVSYTTIPLRIAFFTGLFVSGTSFLYALYVIALRLLNPQLATQGVPTLIVAVFFFGGVNLLFLGFLGEYIAAIYSQVRERPIVVERERINFRP